MRKEYSTRNSILASEQRRVENKLSVIADREVALSNRERDCDIARITIDFARTTLNERAIQLDRQSMSVNARIKELLEKRSVSNSETSSNDHLTKELLVSVRLCSRSTITGYSWPTSKRPSCSNAHSNIL